MKEIEQNLSEVEVYLNSQKVGELALFDRFRIAFQYDNDFIKNGFSLYGMLFSREKRSR